MESYLLLCLIRAERRRERRERLQSNVISRRRLRDNSNPYEQLSNEQFSSLFRLSKDLAIHLTNGVANVLKEVRRQDAIPVQLQVLTALRFYAQGSYQLGVGQDSVINLCQGSVSKIMRAVTEAIISAFRGEIRFPTTREERRSVEIRFNEIGFPGALGCVDCTHIAIFTPTVREEAYVNHHGFHSLNVQMICDEALTIIGVNANFPGSVHDQFIWDSCEVKRELMRVHRERIGSFYLLGDSGYRVEPYLLTPLPHAAAGTSEYAYTQAHMRVRNRVERLFGVLKARFRCLRRDRVLHYQPLTACKIVYACAVLHNLMQKARLPLPAENEMEQEVEETNPLWVDAEDSGRAVAEGRRVREDFIRRHF